MEKLDDYSLDDSLLCIIGDLNTQSPEMNASSRKFFNIITNYGLYLKEEIMSMSKLIMT